ncbi:hypothetical protein MHU86_13332 [Fragilaria crotonensis]|nr:hypothetical protein MHU86_13332 [Fragilaria crotonensis]
MTAPVELPAPSSSKPPVPSLGITLVTKDEWSAWTGGKPNYTWTAQKGYNFRRTGHKISFKPSDDLISFQNVVWDHLKDTGMDSIAYLRDPTDDAKMTNVIKAHARYTVQSAKLLAEAQVQRYDKYDRTNDMAARTYLLASLSTELSNKVTERLDDSDSFPVVWLKFPKVRNTSRSPSDLSTQEEGPRINHCDINDAYLDAPLRRQRRRARRLPKSNGVYRPVSPIGFQGLGNHQWTSKQLQAARKMAMQVNMAKFPNGNYSTILRMALQSTDRFRESLPKASTFPGIAKGLRIEGQGHVLWAMQDTLGNLRMLKVPAYLVSCIKVRLLSTTSLLQAYPGETITIEAHQLTLSGTSDEARGQLIARVNPDNNLPTSDAHRSSDTPKAVAALNITLNTVHESNLNLTEAEKELLRWHHRLGHLSFRKIQFIMRTGVLSRSESHRSLHTAACRIVNPPKCAACQYGKQHQRPAPAKITTVIKD